MASDRRSLSDADIANSVREAGDSPRSIQEDLRETVFTSDQLRSLNVLGRDWNAPEGWRTHFHAQKNSVDQELRFSSLLAASNAKEYLHSPLGKREIRLIVLLPSRDPEAEIRCRLCMEPLDNKPKYEALSYVWGSAENPCSILIDGISFQVTRNLYSALHQLRFSTPKDVRVLWIDALCINQNDVEERNQQVGLMRDIYAGAKETIIWLGPQSNSIAKAFNFVQDFFRGIWPRFDYSFVEQLLEKGDFKMGDVKHLRNLNALLLHPSHQEEWQCLRKLFSLPWWQRIWTLQEAVVSPQAKMMCGARCLRFAILQLFFNIIMVNANAVLESTMGTVKGISRTAGDIMWIVGFYPMFALRIYRMGECTVELPMLMKYTALRQATDPRDYVFAMIGLISKSRFGDDRLSIRYDMTVQEVFINTTKHLIRTRRELDVLKLVDTPQGEHECSDQCKSRKTPDLPSWCPDWQSGSHRTLIDQRFEHEKTNSFNSAQGELIEMPFESAHKSSTLQLKGVAFDRVSFITAPVRGRLVEDTVMWWKSIEEPNFNKLYVTGCTRKEAFWKTLLTDQTTMKERISKDDAKAYPVPPSDADEEKQLIKTTYGVNQLKFFRSYKGYMGLASWNAERDDTVCILLGGDIPFLLRKASRNLYSLVGGW